MNGDELEIITDAVADFVPESEAGIARPERKLVLERGYLAPDEFEYATEVPGLTKAWKDVGSSLPRRELLYLDSMGGVPGGGLTEIIRAHNLPGGASVYSEECEYPEPGTFLIGKADEPDYETDARVVEDILSVDGQRLALAFFGAGVDELRTVLPRERLAPLLRDALDEFDYESLELLDPPEHLEPGSRQWSAWIIDICLAGAKLG
jgi:hypothetical protein